MSGTFDHARWQKVGDLFAEARARPAAERTAYLAHAAADDPALRLEVQELLDSEQAATRDGALEPPTDAQISAWVEAESPDMWVGMALGACRLTRRIAGGGMGMVYEAVQDPPGRKVAVKVLRTVLASDEGRLRFEHEARTLANLVHPGIAQIHEAGAHVTPEGERLPYFVMEFVPGAETITAHARGRALPLRARLALFAQACDAVHFGHTKGVIHRDLKPGNILVDLDGNVKVIDFGIARTTEPGGAGGGTPHTATGQLVGTLPYMSPEQVVGPSSGLDTRSDVYALGVILYELITGKLPYDLEGLSLMETAAAIAQRPPRPPAHLVPESAGDVSVIVQKALAKDPGQRYASAAALSDDLGRFLTYRPILARAPSAFYQLRLFARRNKAGFFGATAALFALVAATVLSTWFAAKESRARSAADAQRSRAEHLLAQTGTLVPWLLREHAGDVARLPGSLAARSRLAEQVRRYLDELQVTEQDHPDVLRAAAAAHKALGDVLGGDAEGNLGRRAESREQYQRALELWTRLLARQPDDASALVRRASVWLSQAFVLRELGQPEEAMRAIQAALDTADARLRVAAQDEEAALLRLSALGARANQRWSDGAREAALADYRAALDAARVQGTLRSAADVRRSLILARLNLGTALLPLGHADEAAEVLAGVAAEARDLETQTDQPGNLMLARYVHWSLGQAWFEVGDLEQAQAGAEGARRCAEAWVARDAQDAFAELHLQQAHGLLALLAARRGRWAQAVVHYDAALPLLTRLAANDPPEGNARHDLIVLHVDRAGALGRLGRIADGRRDLDQAMELARARRRARPDDVHSVERERDVLLGYAGLAEACSQLAMRWGGLLAQPFEGFGPVAFLDVAQWIRSVAGDVWLASLVETRRRLREGIATYDVTRALGGWNDALTATRARLEGVLEKLNATLARLDVDGPGR